jgi:hypothetical protein
MRTAKRLKKRLLSVMLIAILLVLSVANGVAQEAPDNPLMFNVNVTYMTQGGAKKTDSIAILASSPSEAEREAEVQFKGKNPRSTFLRAEAKFVQEETPNVPSRSIVPSTPQPAPKTDSPSTFTVNVTYMTQGGAKKTDRIVILASDPREAERQAETQFKGKNPRSTFLRAETE